MNQNPESCTGSQTPETDYAFDNRWNDLTICPWELSSKLERERNMLASALRDVMNSSDSTSMYHIAKAALNKLTEKES